MSGSGMTASGVVGTIANGLICPRCAVWIAPGATHMCPMTSPAVWSLPQQPIGCVCPPASNLTCENPICPRKAPKT